MQDLGDACSPPATGSQINKLEKGQQNLTQDWMYRLSDALGCDPVGLMPDTHGNRSNATPLNIELPDETIMISVLREVLAIFERDKRYLMPTEMAELMVLVYQAKALALKEGRTHDADTMAKNVIQLHWRRKEIAEHAHTTG